MRYFTHAGFCTNINMSLFMLKKESSVFAICLLICSRMQDIIHMFQSDHAYDLILRLFSVKDCCACNSCRHEHYNHAQHKQDCEQTSLSHSLFQVAPFPFLITRKKTSYICPYFSTTPPPVQIANVLNLCFLRFFHMHREYHDPRRHIILPDDL